MDRGMAFLTEDRRAEGLMMDAPIADNIALPSLPNYAAGWSRLLERTRLGEAVSRTGRDVQVNAGDFVRTLVKNLSGGNQQKVVIGKWLLREPAAVHPRRADPRHRRRRQVRGLQDHQPAGRRGHRHPDDLLGDRGADRHVRPHPGHGPWRDQGRVRRRAQFDREAILRAAMWDGVKGAAA